VPEAQQIDGAGRPLFGWLTLTPRHDVLMPMLPCLRRRSGHEAHSRHHVGCDSTAQQK